VPEAIDLPGIVKINARNSQQSSRSAARAPARERIR